MSSSLLVYNWTTSCISKLYAPTHTSAVVGGSTPALLSTRRLDKKNREMRNIGLEQSLRCEQRDLMIAYIATSKTDGLRSATALAQVCRGVAGAALACLSARRFGFRHFRPLTP
jgi:hypothetical protein